MSAAFGHPEPSNIDGLTAIADVLGRLNDRGNFSRQDCLIEDLPEHTVDTAEFRAEFQWQRDDVRPTRLGKDATLDEILEEGAARTMLATRFGAPGRPVDDDQNPWTLYLRWDWAEDRDYRLPVKGELGLRKLRKALQPVRAAEPTSLRNDDVWLHEDTRPQDVVAQVALFMVQAGISQDASLYLWLDDYLRTNFRLRAVSDEKEDLLRNVRLYLIEHKWWADSWRAWRKYVRKVAHELRPRTRSGAVVSCQPSEHGWTVDQAAQRLDIKRRTLYDRIDRGEVTVARPAGRMYISEAELARLQESPRLQHVILRCKEATGRTVAAARKYVDRQRKRGRTLKEIDEGSRRGARPRLIDRRGSGQGH